MNNRAGLLFRCTRQRFSVIELSLEGLELRQAAGGYCKLNGGYCKLNKPANPPTGIIMSRF